MNYTVFTTYALVPTGSTTGSGYTQAIHCNYIKNVEIETDNLLIQEISLNFSNINDFKFLNSDVGSGTGYTANRIWMLIQTGITSVTLVPDSAKWKIYDVTDALNSIGYSGILTPSGITGVVFKASLLNYALKSTYDLEYIDYHEGNLGFGEETFFFGNVETQIKADVFTTDINIDLPLNEFNSSSNLTWDGNETVYISEIGIYDSNKNLVAIGKLNNPVAKDGTISRTIVFALDF